MRFKWLILLLLLPSAARAQLEEAVWKRHEGRVVVDISYSGDNVTKRYVITREVHTEVGDSLRLEVLKRDIIRLQDLGIFASVMAAPVDYASGVGVEFNLREMPWIIPYLAFRYNEENGWSVGPAASSVNLLGRDIYLTGRMLFGGTNTFDIQLTWPWITGHHVSFDLRAAGLIRDNVVLEFEEDSYEITPWFGRFIRRNGRLKIMPFSWFQMSSDKPGRTLTEDNLDNLYSSGAAIGYDSRDSWRNPGRGWWHEIEFVKTGGRLGGEGDFWTGIFDFRRYQPTWPGQTIVMGALTSLRSGAVGVDVPGYLQYFMGGANSIRGYEFDVLGRELYGKNQFIFTFEYQFEVLDIRAIPIWKWAFAAGLEVALFSDTGTAWSTEDELNWDRVRTGVGVGLRLLIPGTDVARLDVAVGRGGEVHFHFGVWPKLVAQRLRVR